MQPRLMSFRTFACLWGVVLAPLVPMAQGADDLAETLPAGTLGFVKAGPCPWLQDHFGAERMLDLLQQYEIPATARAAKLISQNKEALDALINLLSQPMALVLLDFEYSPRGPLPKFFAVIDAGAESERGVAAIAQVMRLVAPEAAIGTTRVGAAEFQKLNHPDLPQALYWGAANGQVLVAIGESTLRDALSGAQAERDLAGSERLQACRRHTRTAAAAAPMLELFFDFGATRDRILNMAKEHGKDFSPQFMPTMRATGLMDLHALYASVAGTEAGPRISMFLHANEDAPGLLHIFKQQPLTAEDLRILPTDAHYGWVWNLDLAATANRILDVVEEIDPNARGQAEGVLAMASGFLGLSIQDELLPAFGNTWALYDAESHGGALGSGLVLVAEVRDPDAYPALVERVAQLLSSQFAAQGVPLRYTKTQYTRDGITVHFLHGFGGDVVPAWAQVGDYFVLSAIPPTAFVAARALRDGDALIDRPDVRALRDAALPKQLQTFSFVDTASLERNAYAFRVGFNVLWAQLANTPEAAAERYRTFPTVDETLEDVLPALGASAWTPDGYLATRTGTFPNPLGMGGSAYAIAIIAVLVSILLPSLSRARQLAKRAVSASNLRGIGQACHIYAMDNNGKFPPNLQVLVDDFGLTEESLASPLTGPNAYAYIAGQTTDSYPRNVLAYERPYSDEGTNVLFVEGSASFMRPAEFERALRTTFERLGRANDTPSISWPERDGWLD